MEFRDVFLFLEMLWNKIRKFASISVQSTKLWAFFSSAEWFGREFWEFSVLRNSWNSIVNIVAIWFVYSVFRGIIFLSEILANTRHEGGMRKRENNIHILQHSINLKGKVMESRKQYPQIRFSKLSAEHYRWSFKTNSIRVRGKIIFKYKTKLNDSRAECIFLQRQAVHLVLVSNGNTVTFYV